MEVTCMVSTEDGGPVVRVHMRHQRWYACTYVAKIGFVNDPVAVLVNHGEGVLGACVCGLFRSRKTVASTLVEAINAVGTSGNKQMIWPHFMLRS